MRAGRAEGEGIQSYERGEAHSSSGASGVEQRQVSKDDCQVC
jgi:hypothetical protein